MSKTNSMLRLLSVSAFVLTLGASSLVYAESAGQYVDDAAITAKVKAAILADSQLRATQVSVVTNQGTVQLTGTVDTKAQESEAVKVANNVGGVQSVTDSLSVRGIQEQ